MSRFGHGHSLTLGALLTLALLHGHYLWALTAAFGLGLLVGRCWAGIVALLRRSSWPVVEGRYRRRF